MPIVNCEAKYFMPIRLGDKLNIEITPTKINNHLFRVNTSFYKNDKRCASADLVHCSVSANSREKVDLPEKLELWLEASNIKNKVQEC